MNTSIIPPGTLLLTEEEFDLENTFECGQCFRWEKQPDGSYSGIVLGHELSVSVSDGHLTISDSGQDNMNDIWRDYFDLGTSYTDIRAELKENCPSLGCAVDSISGIRILRQDPWETLISFIISQNNNIPRIKGIIKRLCESFGEPCGSGYSFPEASVIAGLSPEELAPLRAGFRAKYILDAAGKVASGQIELEALRSASTEEIRQTLMTIKGVGVKVAECVVLYGFHRTEAFPVDVWIKKALGTLFSGITPEMLGSSAGIAQQYIYHYCRLHPELLS